MVEPFDFLANPNYVDLVSHALQRVGLVVQVATATSISCSCPWLEHRVHLVWTRAWWADGETLEDAAVSIQYDGAEFARCDVTDLLRKKHSRPLAMALIDDLVAACGRLTGKPYSSSPG